MVQARDSKKRLEQVVLLDEQGESAGVAEKLDAHLRALRHLAFSVFVFDSENRLLLQRRALHKYHSGGLWSNTCCSHPRPGENIAAAARRRLMEEMGFSCDLWPVLETSYFSPVSNDLFENEYVHVFVGRYDRTPMCNAEEVMEHCWLGARAIEAEISKHPDNYTVWFRKYWRPAYDRYLHDLLTSV